MKATERVKERKYEIEILERICSLIEDEIKNVSNEYQLVGKEEEQARRYSTGELLYEDEEKTIPLYRDKYEFLPKQTLTDEDKARIAAYEKIADNICKMIG